MADLYLPFEIESKMYPRHCEPTGRADARPMTGSAKQSTVTKQRKNGVLRCARNDIDGPVITGLDPVIHVLLPLQEKRTVDGRVI
jgi:hypothetical protein